MDFQALHQKALLKVKHYTRSVSEVLGVLEEIQVRRAYLDLGYGSMWSYVTQGLKLSERRDDNSNASMLENKTAQSSLIKLLSP